MYNTNDVNKKTFFIDFGKTIAITKNNTILYENINAISIIKKLIENKHNIIINSKRIEFKENISINETIQFLHEKNLIIDKDYLLSPHKINPEPFNIKNKIIFIDDKSLNTELIFNVDNEKFVVDWLKIEKIFISEKII